MVQQKSAWMVLVGILLLTTSLPAAATSQRYMLTAEHSAILTAPLSLNVDGLVIADTHTAKLYRVDGERKILLNSQMEPGHTATLWFVLDRPVAQGQRAELELTIEEASPQADTLSAVVDGTTITLQDKNSPILTYHHAEHPVPEGVNPIFRRSGFIHPLYTPEGLITTRIQPRDHYHHYGIWNPWTVTKIEGREVDFWNLAKGEGTVRFAGLLSTVAGPVYSGFKARQEHVMFVGESKTENVAINEVWDVRAAVMTLEGRPVRVVDLTTTLSNALKSDIELSAYRYGGGLGFRATDDWNKDNLVVLTSEGKTRNEADGTRARWADVRGAGRNKTGTAGVLFLSHVGNREHPEPMRVWPENGGPNGVMFFEFCPIRHNAWTLRPNREYVLRYRMVVYDGTITPETAEVLWNNYAQPPAAVRTVQKAL